MLRQTNKCVYIYIYIYTHMRRFYGPRWPRAAMYGLSLDESDDEEERKHTAHLRTNIMDFRGFDSSIILILRGGIPRPIGDFPESLSQAILVGIMLVERLGVECTKNWHDIKSVEYTTCMTYIFF